MLDAIARFLGLKDQPANAGGGNAAHVAPPVYTPPSISSDDPRLPDNLRQRATAIDTASTAIDAAIARLQIEAFDRPDYRRIRDAHAQDILRAYLDLPEAHRAEVFRRTGKSASFIAAERLDALALRLHEIEKALAERDIDAFNVTMRFIDLAYRDDTSPI